jgi:hypothetical protein
MPSAGSAATRRSPSRGPFWGGLWCGLSLLLALSGCPTASVVPAPKPSPPPSLETAEAVRTRLRAQAPTSFKMLHQVVAKYQDQSYLMAGYMLGRADGSFRVSATAALGPKLFDVAKVDGHWESHVYLKPLAEQLDVTNVGRSVERIYFLPASGPLRLESEGWLSRSRLLNQDELDEVEDLLDVQTLALLRKRYFKDGKKVVQVDLDKLELVQGSWVARNVKLTDARGFSLELQVTGYTPGFPVPDSVLRVQQASGVSE